LHLLVIHSVLECRQMAVEGRSALW